MDVCFNGEFYSANTALLTSQNRCFKWGDGIFETMKVFQGKLLLSEFHFERLFISLKLLQIGTTPDFSEDTIIIKIFELCSRNNCLDNARIRMAVFREENDSAGYLLEANPLDKNVNRWNEGGQEICIYPYARKNMDAFANLKSANFLPYVLAQRHALKNGFDDAIVLNANNFLCDSSKANIFLIKNREVFTPALHQGCINGVMRRVVVDVVKKLGLRLHQQEIGEEDIISADEVFLTNSIQIIRWVKSYNNNSQYGFAETKKIFDAVSTIIFGETTIGDF